MLSAAFSRSGNLPLETGPPTTSSSDDVESQADGDDSADASVSVAEADEPGVSDSSEASAVEKPQITASVTVGLKRKATVTKGNNKRVRFA